MAGLTQLVVVQLNQGKDGVVDGGQLHERHLPVLREELERNHVQALGQEGLLQVGLFNRRRDVGQVKG